MKWLHKHYSFCEIKFEKYFSKDFHSLRTVVIIQGRAVELSGSLFSKPEGFKVDEFHKMDFQRFLLRKYHREK